jgi:hypothetical protein
MLISFCIPLAEENLGPNPEPCLLPGVGLQICETPGDLYRPVVHHGAALREGGSWIGHRTFPVRMRRFSGPQSRRFGYPVDCLRDYPLRRAARHGGLTILEVRRVDAIYGPSIGMSPDAKWPGAIRLALIFVVPDRTSPGEGDGEFP